MILLIIKGKESCKNSDKNFSPHAASCAFLTLGKKNMRLWESVSSDYGDGPCDAQITLTLISSYGSFTLKMKPTHQ